MRHLSPLAKAQRAVRATICPTCRFRTEGTETWSASKRRPCQGECTIFLNLPRVREITGEVTDPTLVPYADAVNETICQTCTASPTSGDYCAERSTANCPLAVYLGDVVDVLERLAASPARRPRPRPTREPAAPAANDGGPVSEPEAGG